MTTQQLEEKLEEIIENEVPATADAEIVKIDASYIPVDEALVSEVQKIVKEEIENAESYRIRDISQALPLSD